MGQESTGPPVGAPALPPPSSLPKGSANSNGTGRFRWGYMFENAMPFNKVVPGGLGTWASFEPDWDPPATASLSDTAYAIYSFTNMTGYAGASRVKLGWEVPPAAPGRVYVGLANLERDCWVWSMLPPSCEIHPASLDPYISPTGECYTCVLALGTDEVRLDWVLLGGNMPINISLVTDLNPDPLLNLAPRTVQFDASASTAYGGRIVSFDFDWEGDGGWDATGDATGITWHHYTAGTYGFWVRATDNEGQVATYSLPFVIINPANTPPNAALIANPDTGDAPLTVTLDASGTTDDGTIIRYQWDLDNDWSYDEDTGSTPTLEHTFAIKGLQTVIVLVTDNDLATDEASTTLMLQSGWCTCTVVNGVEVVERMTSCVSGTGFDGRVCLAYQEHPAKKLKFVRATAADGSAWGPVRTPDDAPWKDGYGVSMWPNPVSTVPMIAYGVYEEATHDYYLFFNWADNVLGSSWHGRVGVINGLERTGADNALRVIGGRPSIASVDEGGTMNSRILFYRANDATGTTWGAPVEALPHATDRMIKAVSLISAGGYAVIAFGCSGTGPGESWPGVVSAKNTTGTAWYTGLTFGPSDCGCTGLVIADGNPAWCSGSHSMSGCLYYRRADSSTGDSWSGPPSELAGAGFGGDCAMASVGGVPAIAYSSFTNQDLWYLSAADAAGSSWLEPVQVRTAGHAGRYVTMTAIYGNPVICYYDETIHRIAAAWYEN